MSPRGRVLTANRAVPAIVTVAFLIMIYELHHMMPKQLHPHKSEDEVDVVLRTCNCSAPAVLTSSASLNHTASLPDSGVIDVIISIDRRTLLCSAVLMNSVIRHTNSSVFFHILVTELDPDTVTRYLDCYHLPPHYREIVVFNSSVLTDAFPSTYNKYKGYGSKTNARHMHKDAMYARLFFHRLFPWLSLALYLDADIVLQGDIQELWDTLALTASRFTISGVHRVAAMAERDKYGFYFRAAAQRVFHNRYHKQMDPNRATFVNGVYLANLDRWRAREAFINKELMFWMDQNNKYHWWTLGTNTLTFLVFYDDWVAVAGSEWHLESLGWKNMLTIKEVDTAKLIHFNGGNKPWDTLGTNKYAIFWNRQKPRRCENP